MTKIEELQKEFEELHEELVEQYASTTDCGWEDWMENDLYKVTWDPTGKTYLYDDIEADLIELIRRVKQKLAENQKYLEEAEGDGGFIIY